MKAFDTITILSAFSSRLRPKLAGRRFGGICRTLYRVLVLTVATPFLNGLYAQVYPYNPTNFYINRVKDINAGSDHSEVTKLTDVNGTIFFSADNGSYGKELWKSDGTEAGTVMVKNIHSSGSSYPMSLANFNGTLLFSAETASAGRELWKSDGTSAGTVMIKDINTSGSSDPVNFVIIGDVAYFTAETATHGRELWKTDGTSAGTVMVKDVTTGGGNTFSSAKNLHAMNNLIYFLHNNELWRSNGTSAGTYKINIFTYDDFEGDILGEMGGKLYLGFKYSTSSGYNFALFNTPGSGLPTLLKTLPGYSYHGESTATTTQLFFAIDKPGGSELWSSNGTVAGTKVLRNQGTVYTLLTYKNKAYFGASYNGDYLYESSGTVAGTKMVIAKKANGLTVAGGRLFFSDYYGCWNSDGTAAGTKKATSTAPGDIDFTYSTFVGSGTKVFFYASVDGYGGRELYKASPCTACPVAADNAYPNLSQAESTLRVVVKGNPVSDEIVAEISGAQQLLLTNSAGRVFGTRILNANESSVQTFDVRNYAPGIYLLNASTIRENKVVKVLKVGQ